MRDIRIPANVYDHSVELPAGYGDKRLNVGPIHPCSVDRIVRSPIQSPAIGIHYKFTVANNDNPLKIN